MNQRISDLSQHELWSQYKKTYLVLQNALLESYEKTKDKDFLKMMQEAGDTYQQTKERIFGNVC